jgi:hypothetical protein
MVKMLTGRQPLRKTWHEFMAQVKALLLGGRVFDATWWKNASEQTCRVVRGAAHGR